MTAIKHDPITTVGFFIPHHPSFAVGNREYLVTELMHIAQLKKIS